jgi:perosamine synthetase
MSAPRTISNYKISVYEPDLRGNERQYVLDCLDSTWISSKGKYLPLFENAFASYLEIPFATAVCNGTVALHLALLALGIRPGDEVIVPTLTYVASVNAITYVGATPVFVDSLRDTWQMDPEDVVRKITPRTRAIMAVHLYGHPCDMDAIAAIARHHDLFIIEDCAEAFGSRYHSKHVGIFGDVGTFSFYGNKTITTGEGGMVVTKDADLLDRVVNFKGQGLAPNREYWHDVIGYNYRMTNICAAIGLAQVERADELIAQKRRLAKAYAASLAGLPVEVHGEAPNVVHSYWMVSILTGSSGERNRLREVLANDGIETRPVFYPIHTMPMYAAGCERLMVAEEIGAKGIVLPSWPGLSSMHIDEICRSIARFYSDTAIR